MKILYYSPNPNLNLQDTTGYGTHMREIIKAFRLLGHEVFQIIGGGTNNSEIHKLNKSKFKKVLKQLTPLIIWESIKDNQLIQTDKQLKQCLITTIKEINPDLIYERGNYLQVSGIEAAKDYGIKHYLEINAPYVEERISFSGKSIFTSKAQSIERKQLMLSDKVFVVSSILKDYFIQKFNIDARKICVIPNAIDTNNMNVDSRQQEIIKKELGVNSQTIIGFVGSVFPYHGVDLLLKAFSQIVTKHKNIHLLIVGDGEILSSLKKYAKELGIDKMVTFTGNIEHGNIYNYIKIMDITVMAKSNWYGSPVKIFEYGAMGKAIIAPNVAPVKDVMIDGTDGLLINPSVDELVSAISRLFSDVNLRNKLGKSFQEKVLMKHSWEKMAQKILSQ